MSEKFTVGLIVNNQYGVLNRISGMYHKRGYNIESLTVGATENPKYSRMTIVSKGDDYAKSQVYNQLNKLHDVKMVVLLEDDAVSLEHLLIKLKSDGQDTDIAALLNAYGAKIMDLAEGYIIVDMTGDSDKIDEFIEKCVPIGILELCRSGAIALSKDNSDLLSAMYVHERENYE